MIQLHAIDYATKQKTIFHDFTLHVAPKERLVIQGSSGAGKTTLLRLIAGLEVPQKGDIIIDNHRVSKAGDIIPAHKRGISMVFQDLALWPHLTVADNITYALRIQKVSQKVQKSRQEEMLALVGLEGYASRDIRTLSGGEAQRIALARALASRPKIILMDEPLSSLDEKRNKILRQEIIQLQETLGFTLVYITHNHAEAKEIGTRMIHM